MRRGIQVAVLTALSAATAFGQVDAGTITGTVHDSTGAVIAGATVIIESAGTGQRIETGTGAQGIYVSPPLRPGEFTVEVRSDGFEPAAKRFQLEVNQRAVVDFDLNLGTVTEVVEVLDVAPLLQTESATLSNLRTEKAIKDLPLNGRNWAQLILLSSGAQPADTQSQGSPITRKRGVSNASVNGSRSNDNNYLIEGVSNSENHNGLGILIFPSIDAIQEFRSETSGADAQFGRGGGATVNLTFKSGTREFHGGMYEFLRNARLDAKNFFDRADEPIPPFKQNQYGAFVGGPVVPGAASHRSFFFANFEGQRVRQAQTLISSVPTADFRTGNFAQSPFTIFDPTTQLQLEDGGYVRDQFPNNAIPRPMQSQVGQNILNLYPGPNRNAETTDNFLYNPVRSINGERFDIKVDHLVSDANSMFVRYSFSDDDLIEPSFLPAPAVGAGPEVPGPADQPVNQVVLSDTHMVSPTKINEFRVGWTRLNLRSFNPNYGRNVSDELGIPGSNVEGDDLTSGLAIITVAGFRSMGGNGFSPAVIVSDNYQVSDTFSVISGRHSIKFGGEVRRLRYNALQSNALRGTLRFSNNYTINPASRRGTGLGPADVLLGKPSSGFIRFVRGTRGYRRTEIAFHLQDTYKVNERLTLNLGVRYDNFLGWPWTEVNDRQHNFLRSAGTVVQVGTGEVPWRSGSLGDNNNFSPRFGVAYKAAPQTVFRFGYGLYYSTGQLDTTRNLGANPPEVISSNFNNNLFNFMGARPASMGFDRPELGVVAGTLRSIDLDTVIPYTQQWNATIQQQVGEMSFTIAYVGSKGTSLQGQTDINQAVPGTGPVAARRDFPAFGAIRQIQSRYDSNYHSLQMSAERRFSNGLGFLASYTWGKAISNVDSQFGTPTDIRNIGRDRGPAGFNSPRRLVTSFMYNLPFQADGALNHVVGGWQINGILTLYDGFPMRVVSPNTLNCCTSYPDRIGDGRLPRSEQTLRRFFDVDAFERPGPQMFGNAGRNILFGPGTKTLDFSVFKEFFFSEDQARRLQFRAEFFNFTNTPQFNNPTTNIGNANVGRIRSAASTITLQRIPRHIQFALKLYF